MKFVRIGVLFISVLSIVACSTDESLNTGELIVGTHEAVEGSVSPFEISPVSNVDQSVEVPVSQPETSPALDNVPESQSADVVNGPPLPEGTDYEDVSTLDWVELPAQYIGKIVGVRNTMPSNAIALIARSDSSQYPLLAYSPRKYYNLEWEENVDIVGADCLSLGMTTLRVENSGTPTEGFDLHILCNGGNSAPQFAFIEEGSQVPFRYYRHINLSDGDLRGASIDPFDRRITLTASRAADHVCNAHVASIDGSDRIDVDTTIALGSLCHVSLSYDVLDHVSSDDLVITLQNGYDESDVFGTMTLVRVEQQM